MVIKMAKNRANPTAGYTCDEFLWEIYKQFQARLGGSSYFEHNLKKNQDRGHIGWRTCVENPKSCTKDIIWGFYVEAEEIHSKEIINPIYPLQQYEHTIMVKPKNAVAYVEILGMTKPSRKTQPSYKSFVRYESELAGFHQFVYFYRKNAPKSERGIGLEEVISDCLKRGEFNVSQLFT